jgi:hypothetical protein
MGKHSVCLNDLRSQPVEFQELAEAMQTGFTNVLGVEMQPASLTAAEQTLVRELEEQQMQNLAGKWPGISVMKKRPDQL